MSEGFLQRWSRRKREGGEALPDEKPRTEAPATAPAAAPASTASHAAPSPAVPAQSAEPVEASPLPTLDDVQALTPESDFKPFVARNVAPEVRNAAMKKLFADPHFNVMDRMDVYIDDYSNPAPLPEASLRKMASAVFLKLVDEEEEVQAPAGALQETPAMTQVQDVAQSELPGPDPSQPLAAPTEGAQPASQQSNDDHADLRLQHDDAARAEDPRRGTS